MNNFAQSMLLVSVVCTGCASTTAIESNSTPDKRGTVGSKESQALIDIEELEHRSANRLLQDKLIRDFGASRADTNLYAGESEIDRTSRLIELRGQYEYRDSLLASKASDDADRKEQRFNKSAELIEIKTDASPAENETINNSDGRNRKEREIEGAAGKVSARENEQETAEAHLPNSDDEPKEDQKITSIATGTGSESDFDELLGDLQSNPRKFFSDHSGLAEVFRTMASGCKANIQVYGGVDGRAKAECQRLASLIKDDDSAAPLYVFQSVNDLIDEGSMNANDLDFRMRMTLRRVRDGFQALDVMKYL